MGKASDHGNFQITDKLEWPEAFELDIYMLDAGNDGEPLKKLAAVRSSSSSSILMTGFYAKSKSFLPSGWPLATVLGLPKLLLCRPSQQQQQLHTDVVACGTA